jgi:hypothetical protein
MYGLKEKDLIQIQKKHEMQRDYLKNHNFETGSGQIKTLLDVSFSANHSKRYYSELLNKINTINDLIASEEIQYQSIFITITLDGYFRDFLKGDFKRYDEKKHSKNIPNNDRFGALRDKITKKEKFTIKDLYNVLNFQLNRFQKSNIFKKIKEDGHKAHYIRVCEPHKKDGVPHLHLMLYVPVKYVSTLKDFYISYFPAPQNIKPLDKSIDDGQLKGFQWEIKSAPAYILKYIFKSFLNVQNETELDYLQAWYIKNRILRIVTSHSLVPAWVYRKIVPLEKDWFYLTDIRNNFISEWSKEDDYIRLEDQYNRTLEYKQGIYKLYYKDRIIKQFGTKKIIIKSPKIQINGVNYLLSDKKDQFIIKSFVFTSYITKKLNMKYKKRIKEPKIIIDGINYIQKENKLEKIFIKKPIIYTSNIELYRDYISMENKDVDSIDLNHYALVKNELIKRKLISGDIVNIDDYNFHSIFETASKLEILEKNLSKSLKKAYAKYIVRNMDFIPNYNPCYDIPYLSKQLQF